MGQRKWSDTSGLNQTSNWLIKITCETTAFIAINTVV